MKLTVAEIETLINWWTHIEYPDTTPEKELEKMSNKNEKLRLKLVKQYQKLRKAQ